MRPITRWAFRNKNAARFSIAAIQIYLLVVAMILAGYWQENDKSIPVKWMLAMAIITSLIAAVLHYWKKSKGWGGWHPVGYGVVRVKYLMVAVAAFTALLTWFYTNSHIRYDSSLTLRGSFVKMEPQRMQRPLWDNYSDKIQYYNDLQQYYKTLNRKQLNAELKTTMQKKQQLKAEGGDVGLIILIILGALVATYFLLALSCSISCSGSDAGAVVVGVLGLAGIIWASIALIKGVKRKSMKRAKENDLDNKENP